MKISGKVGGGGDTTEKLKIQIPYISLKLVLTTFRTDLI